MYVKVGLSFWYISLGRPFFFKSIPVFFYSRVSPLLREVKMCANAIGMNLALYVKASGRGKRVLFLKMCLGYVWIKVQNCV